ncbi:methionine ABC transporter permease, partial [Streptococcus agalactiae]|nr:methionine ABC transporter permease [Streptococcus agalactiae]
TATWQTLAMTAISSVLTVIGGVILGLVLVGTGKGGLFPNRAVNQILGTIVNIGRSFPFVILVVAIIPFTRMVAGTSIGWKAAIVPLTVGAIPFFARLVESNLLGIEPGKIEAAKMMGASRRQIMFDVQIREALPALIQSITVTVITLIGYSAITGML